jgi:hypothetical protein
MKHLTEQGIPHDIAAIMVAGEPVYWPMAHVPDDVFNGVVNLGRVERVDRFDDMSDHGMQEIRLLVKEGNVP